MISANANSTEYDDGETGEINYESVPQSGLHIDHRSRSPAAGDSAEENNNTPPLDGCKMDNNHEPSPQSGDHSGSTVRKRRRIIVRSPEFLQQLPDEINISEVCAHVHGMYGHS
jgi:hypothetical protein